MSKTSEAVVFNAYEVFATILALPQLGGFAEISTRLLYVLSIQKERTILMGSPTNGFVSREFHANGYFMQHCVIKRVLYFPIMTCVS